MNVAGLLCQSSNTGDSLPAPGWVLRLGPEPLSSTVITLTICHLEVTSVRLTEPLAGAVKTLSLLYGAVMG